MANSFRARCREEKCVFFLSTLFFFFLPIFSVSLSLYGSFFNIVLFFLNNWL